MTSAQHRARRSVNWLEFVEIDARSHRLGAEAQRRECRRSLRRLREDVQGSEERTQEPESGIDLPGLQSDDLGYGQTGVILAELLGFAHATIVMEVEPQGASVRVKRELEDGWYQHVTLPLPVVLTIQSGIKKLRYATLMGIKKAKSKELKTIPAADLSVQATPNLDVERIYLPQRSKQTQIFTGDARHVAQQLAEKLKFEARVI